MEDKTHSVPLSLKSESDLIVEIIAVAVRREESSSDGRCLSQTALKMQNNPLPFCPDSIILRPLYSSRHHGDGDDRGWDIGDGGVTRTVHGLSAGREHIFFLVVNYFFSL